VNLAASMVVLLAASKDDLKGERSVDLLVVLRVE
jgi:hypothetical protein